MLYFFFTNEMLLKTQTLSSSQARSQGGRGEEDSLSLPNLNKSSLP